MNTGVFHRRRVERFAQLLDEAEGGIRHHSRSTIDAELTPMVELGVRAGDLTQSVGPDPVFRAELRTMLVAAAMRDGVGITSVTPPDGDRVRQRRSAGALAGTGSRISKRLRTRGAIVIGVAAGTLALSGMSAASGDALPGDALYGIKRSTERAQLALASSDVSRGQLYLEFAKTRVAEATAVQEDPAGLVAVLTDMDAETRQGVRLLNTAAVARRDPAALDVVNRFVDEQQRRVAALLEGQPPVTRTRVLESLTLLESVTRRTGALRTALNCGATGVGTDLLGPLPDICQAAGPGQQSGQGSGTPGGTGQPTQLEQGNPANGAAQPGGTGTGQPADAVTPTSSPAPDGDGNILSDLGRFLDDLLGG